MNKMCRKRRRTKKLKKKTSNFMKSIEKIKIRVPTAPSTTIFKTKKSYDRKKNNKIIREDKNNA